MIETEGIRYAGSKVKLIPNILELASKVGDVKTVWDAFSGTTRVAQALAQKGYQVIASDISVWSKCFGVCYLMNKQDRHYYQNLIDYLNSIPPIDGWFTENYSKLSKKPWQDKNLRKLDAIREGISKLNLTVIEECVLLTALILGLDKVDNTLGHQVSYLKEFSTRSYNDLQLEVPKLFPEFNDENRVCQGDIFELIPKITADLVYIDPPYGSSNEKVPTSRIRYASYYHLWTTIILNDKPKLFGKANRREDTKDAQSISVFEEYKDNPVTGKSIALEAMNRLIKDIQAKYIILSYSNNGRILIEQVLDIACTYGTVLGLYAIQHKQHAMAQMTWTKKWVNDKLSDNKEFLILIQK